MEKTYQILEEVRTLLLQADLRVRLIDENVISPNEDIMRLQIGMESIHNLTTTLANTLLKTIIRTLRLAAKPCP